MARNVKFEIRRGAGSSLEVLFGKVSLTPTMLHTVANSVVLPAPTTFDLVNGIAIATNVAPSPEPVAGQVPWAYRVKISDNHGKTFEYLVGVPEGTSEINFNVLPRYFETKPPLFGQGEQGVPGSAATIAIGTTTSGPTPSVSNTGTSTEAVLNFTLAKGDKGDKGDPGVSSVDWANAAANSAAAAEASKQAAIAASQLVDAPSDEVVRGLVASPTTLTYGSVRNAVRDVVSDVVSDVSPESTMDEAVKGLIETVGTQTQTALSAAIAQQVEDPDSLTSDSLDRSYVRTPAIRPNDWLGRIGVALAMPTPDPVSSAGEMVHPSVLHFPGGWNGFAYWMGVTPYAGGNDAYEDPCILASSDGSNWQVPAGLANPLDNAPGGANYNSDTNLAYQGGKLHLFWRNYDSAAIGKEETLWVRTSTNGANWTPKVKVYESDKNVRRLVSPSFRYENGVWTMWAIDLKPTIKTMVRLTTTSLTGVWSEPTICTVHSNPGKMPWHLNVIKSGGQYIGLLNDTLQGGTGARDGDLRLIVSSNGVNWSASAGSVIPRVGPAHDNLYAASLIPTPDGFDVWYSARITASPSVWSLLRTFLRRINPGGPYAVAGGSETLGTVNADGGSDERVVVFPAGLFTKAPVVTMSSGNGRINPGTAGITKDGFTIKGFNWTTANAVNPIVSWVATQMTN